MLQVEAAAAGPAPLPAAALGPALGLPVDPVHPDPVALVPPALDPPLLRAHLDPQALAADVMITGEGHVQRQKHRKKMMRRKDGKGVRLPNQPRFT